MITNEEPKMIKITHGTVVSADGTKIGYSQFGEGPPLIVCHGTLTIAEDWTNFARELGASNTVYLYDRRGRGRSPDIGKPYSFATELDDLAAMVKLAGPDTAILGHSFGGDCALAYALRDGFVGRLVMYEPMNSIPRQITGGHVPELVSLINENKLEEALKIGLEKIIRLSKTEIEMFRNLPFWKPMVMLTPSFIREIDALDKLIPTVEDLGKLRAHTWILLGTQSVQDPNRTCTAALIERIPGLILYPIFDQGHLAYLLDPAFLSGLVSRCLTEDPKVASYKPNISQAQLVTQHTSIYSTPNPSKTDTSNVVAANRINDYRPS